jgi:hypothetical protein
MATIAGLSFYVGMLEGQKSRGESVSLLCRDDVLSTLAIPLKTDDSSVPKVVEPSTKGKFAGSKNGTKYYAPGCTGLNRIKPENIIWFQNAEDATLQGYTPASC